MTFGRHINFINPNAYNSFALLPACCVLASPLNEIIFVVAAQPGVSINSTAGSKPLDVACKLMRQSLIILSVVLTSCVGQYNDKQKVYKDNVDYVEIRKQFDTVSLRLTAEQVADFIDNWNSSNLKGPHKYLPEYSLVIHYKGDSSLTYRTSSNLIKQRSDWAYSVGDKDYFKNIWFKQAGLTDKYFEYFPTYEKEGKFSKDRNPLDKKHCASIKQVLTYYNYKLTDIRGQIFYEGKIDDELLWNYTIKANDSIWLSSHR